MCGRYVIEGVDEFSERLTNLTFQFEPRPTWNASPTQTLPVIVANDDAMVAKGMRWGLIPGWADPAKLKQTPINARSETVAEKPMFRSAIKKQRAIVPASGFYEWKRSGSVKLPYYIHLADGSPMWLAGLWEWNGKLEEPQETFTILTTAANEQMAGIHDRMPVILDQKSIDEWLDQDLPFEPLERLLRPLTEGRLDIYEVDRKVGSPRNNDPTNIDPVS